MTAPSGNTSITTQHQNSKHNIVAQAPQFITHPSGALYFFFKLQKKGKVKQKWPARPQRILKLSSTAPSLVWALLLLHRGTAARRPAAFFDVSSEARRLVVAAAAGALT